MVRRIALRLVTRLPANIEVDDLIAAGMMGLLECARRYIKRPPSAQFSTYAMTRIKGAMIDEIRRQDWMPRLSRTRATQLQTALLDTEKRLGGKASSVEIAKTLGISHDQYQAQLSDLCGLQVLYAEDLSEAAGYGGAGEGVAHGADPLEQLQSEGFRAALSRAITELPEREQLILSLSYDQEMNYKEISAILDISEARVSQLRTQAILRLRAALGEHNAELAHAMLNSE